ncbi:hypothetical protein B0G77_2235 [Paraburkholderia sp. BL10I2N1]|nr:hypothetical protein B0G77_2235 [Paraburkholderia sp. BL10I2N1]
MRELSLGRRDGAGGNAAASPNALKYGVYLWCTGATSSGA